MRILLIGPPGAAKGTQAVRLAAHLSIPHISTGYLFREHIDQGTELSQNTHIRAGLLVPDEVTTGVIEERLARPDIECGFLLLNPEELSGRFQGRTGRVTLRLLREGDLMAGHELMSPWDGYSSAGVSIRSWPGGPFYLHDRPAEFAEQRVSDVRASPRLPASRPTVRQEASWG
ncbi:nucleoside monophosphate kinase [Streptomyces anulatus]